MTSPIESCDVARTESGYGWRDWLILVLVIGVGAWVRFSHIDSGLSFDELWHLASTQGVGSAMSYYKHDVVYHDAIRLTSLEHAQNLWHVWTGMDGILHPPLFIVALRLWREVFGQSDLAAHGYSIFCGLVAIGFTYASGRLAMNRIAGMLAAMALTLSQTQVYFSQEVRAYAMLTGLAAIALWLMTRITILGPTRKRALVLALLTLPIQMTHYFAFGACLAIALFGLLASGPHRKAFIVGLLASGLIFCLVWLPFALQQLNDLQTGDSFLKLDEGVTHVMPLLSGMPFRLIAERDYEMEFAPVFSGVIFLIPWLLIRRLRALLPWALLLCLSVLPMVMLDLTRGTVHTAYVRYFAVASPAVPLLVVGIVWSMGYVRTAYVSGAVLTFVGGIYLFSGNKILLDADDFSSARRIIDERIKHGDVIVTYSGVGTPYHCDAAMLTMSHSEKFPSTIAVITRPMTPDMVADLNARSIWLIRGPSVIPVHELIPGARSVYSRVATMTMTVEHLMIDAPTSAPLKEPAPASRSHGSE